MGEYVSINETLAVQDPYKVLLLISLRMLPVLPDESEENTVMFVVIGNVAYSLVVGIWEMVMFVSHSLIETSI